MASVVVGDQTLFAIRSKLGPFSAEYRAKAASAKRKDIVNDVRLATSAITTDPHEDSTDIVAGDVIVTTVTEQDAAAAGVPRSTLANGYVKQIRSAISTLRGE